LHSDLDAAWFRAHPKRRFRLRRATDLEIRDEFRRERSEMHFPIFAIVSRAGEFYAFVASLKVPPEDDDPTLERIMRLRRIQ
jgi:hypothetical protein